MDREELDRYQVDRSPQAAARLTAKYYPLVYSVCRRYLRRRQDVEDAVQETFVKLMRSSGSIQANLTAWLASTAQFTSIDLIRRNSGERRRRKKLGRSSPALLEHRMRHEAIGGHLHEAMLHLDGPSRDLLDRRFFQRMPLRGIAGQTDASIATISRRIQQAISDLSAVLRDMGIESADDLSLVHHFGHPGHMGWEEPTDCDGLRFAPDWRTATLAPPDLNTSRGFRPLPGWSRPIRVGIFVGYQTTVIPSPIGQFMTMEEQVRTTRLFTDPGLQLVGIVEPGTSGLGPIEGTLRDFEVFGGLIDGTDAEALRTLDVILFPNNYILADRVAEGLIGTVESGVGLLKEFWCRTWEVRRAAADPAACKLLLADSPICPFHMTHCGQQVRTVIREEHPAFPGLRAGTSFELSGCGPVYRLAAGATVVAAKEHWVLPEEHRIAGLGAIRPAAIVAGHLGAGRVVVVHGNHVRIARQMALGADYFTNLLAWLAEPRRLSTPAHDA